MLTTFSLGRKAAPQWPIQQMAKADVNILRLAVFELLGGKTPTEVAAK